MKRFAMVLCGVLLACAANADKVSKFDETAKIEKWRSRENGGRLMTLRLKDGTTISLPPQFMSVSAAGFAYKNKGAITVLRGSATKHASVKITDSVSQEAIQITSPEIEVETALTEIQILDWDDSEPLQRASWLSLLGALKAAPQSSRFRLDWDDFRTGSVSAETLIYDRRSRNLYRAHDYTSQTSDKFTHNTESNITDAEIEKRAANSQGATKSTPE